MQVLINIMFSIVFFITCFGTYFLRRKWYGAVHRLRLGSERTDIRPSPLMESKDILRNRISDGNLRKIQNQESINGSNVSVDYLVIGSGISGLTAASILSFLGNKVLVLEQHDVAGGALHVFKDKGYLFEVGLHYVGEPKQSVLDILTITTDPEIPIHFHKMNDSHKKTIPGLENVYDTFVSGDKTINLRSGKQGFVQGFLEHDEFKPHEHEIRRLVDDIVTRDQSSIFYYLSKTFGSFGSKVVKFLLGRNYMLFNQMNGYEYLKQYISSDNLIYAIGGSIGDLGRSLRSTPAFCVKEILRHYMDGGYYPAGGSERLIRSLVSNILKRGGDVLVNARVTDILTDDDKGISGVRVKKSNSRSDKEWVIEAKNIVSSAGIINTFRLAGLDPLIGRLDGDSVSESQYYQNFVMTFVGLNKGHQELKIGANNTWIRSEPIDQEILIRRFTDLCLEFLDTRDDRLFDSVVPPMFISPNSTKDRDWDTDPDNRNKTTVSLIGLVDHRLYDRLCSDGLLEQRVGYRDAGYQELKRLIEESLIRGFIKQYPGAEESIDYVETSTPITFDHYLGSWRGNCYGIGVSQNKFFGLQDDARIDTPVQGLYMVGQDIISPGILGSMESVTLLLYRILGYNQILNIAVDQILGTDPVKDMVLILKNQKLNEKINHGAA